MTYVFDTSSLIKMFGFYPKRFPTLWRNFNNLIQENRLVSVREVLNEINRNNSEMILWAKDNNSLFHSPSTEDALFLMEIFRAKNGHFQQIIKKTNILTGSPVADPFVIAKAKVISGAVITEEKASGSNGSKIPDICKHFSVNSLNLEEFMEREEWSF